MCVSVCWCVCMLWVCVCVCVGGWVRLTAGMCGWMKQVMNALQAWALDQGLEHVRIDGATSLAHRHARLRLFNKNASVGLALVSVTAGGQGIDLTAASTAVFVQVRV